MISLKIIPLLLILLAVILRLLPHPANFSPVTAIALFGAVYLPKRFGLTIPLLVMFITDMIISGFYGITLFFVYGSFFISGLLGLWLKKHLFPQTVVISAITGSVIFFIITNFGAWLELSTVYNYYSKDFAGLTQSYIMALPFFRVTILGDLVYTCLFFGGYEICKILLKKYTPVSVYSKLF